MLEACKRMTPDQRVQAYLRLSRTMYEIHLSGKKSRAEQSKTALSKTEQSIKRE